jgi:hypothetical protein
LIIIKELTISGHIHLYEWSVLHEIEVCYC